MLLPLVWSTHACADLEALAPETRDMVAFREVCAKIEAALTPVNEYAGRRSPHGAPGRCEIALYQGQRWVVTYRTLKHAIIVDGIGRYQP